MKKLWLSLVLAVLLALTCIVTASASDTVVFLADDGSGDGTSADAPVGTAADAYAALGDNGGTIVICGKYTVGNTSAIQMPSHTGTVTITSVYGDTDYREDGATLSFNGTSFAAFNGPTVFDGLTMTVEKSAAGICMNFNNLTIGYDVDIVQSAGGTGYYMYLIGGPNNNTSVSPLGEGEVFEMNIYSGKYHTMSGFSRSNSNATHKGTAIVTLGGTADVSAFCGGPLSTGAAGGTSIVNVFENASVTTFYLGGYNCAAMNGDIAVNVGGNAVISKILNCDEAYFATTDRYLNIYGENVTLPTGYADCFDTVANVENTVFVKDGATGDGLTPVTPTGSIETAYAAVGESGGTVVLIGDYTTTSTVKFPAHSGTVTLTSVFGGVDYRAVYGAGLHFAGTGFIKLYGPTVIDYINLELDKATAGFCANYNPLTIGYNVKTVHATGVDGYYLYLVGGPNGETEPTLGAGETNEISIYSGKYATVTPFSRSAALTSEGTVTLNIGSDVDIKELALGSISAGSSAGNAVLNLSENANVTKLYLGGHSSNGMSGDITVNIDGEAAIGTIANYDATFFPSGTKTLNILSVDTSLPSDYAEVFDTVTTVNQKLTVALTLPDGAPASDKLTHLLIDGKTGAYTMSESDGVITVEFETVLDEVTLSLTYKDGTYQRIDYTVTVSDGVATASLASNKTYDGSVIYVASGASGDGLSAASPVATLLEAYEMMLTDSGTIVVCGEVSMVKCIAPAHTGAVTVTSVYGGTDYREGGARLYYPSTSTWVLGGETVFRDITIDLDVNGLISAAFNPVTFDTGVEINYDCSEADANGLYLVGGYNTGAIPTDAVYTKDSSITLRSGSFSRVFGFSRYVGAQDQTGTANITLEGDAYVRYLVAGATGNAATSNSANITISDNVIVETLYLGGLEKTNYMYGETVVDITGIASGTIYEFDGISLYAMVNGTDTLRYDPRTVPDGVLHLASLAWVDNILTLCDIASEHTFGEAYASPFDETMQIHTCTLCGFTSPLEEVGSGDIDGVVFVADGGFGDGSSPATPLGSYADAFDTLGDKVGECTLPKNMKYKHGSDPEFYQEPMHTGKVTVTSVYGGIDYREKGAKLIFDGTMDYKLSGSVTFDDITFDVTDASAENTIAARYNSLTFGDGVKMLKTYSSDGYKLNVVGGYKFFRYTDFAGVEIEDEWLRLLNHAVRTDTIELPDSGTLNIGGTTPRAATADAFNALWAEMEELGMQLPIVSSSMQTYEWKHDFFANFLGNTRVNHPDWSYEKAHTYVTKSCGEPGGSEHHLGVAVDMYDNTIDSDSQNHDYNTTAEWAWLVTEGNAARYGIILRYPSNEYCSLVTGTIPEAWHFRYIGVEHAKAYTEGGYPIFEFYVGDTIGLFAKDSDVSLCGGSFYSVNGGSAECDGITFTGTNNVTVTSGASYESITDVATKSGDVTGDGKVTLIDVIRLLKYVTNGNAEINMVNADMNGDGEIDIKDVLAIIKAILN